MTMTSHSNNPDNPVSFQSVTQGSIERSDNMTPRIELLLEMIIGDTATIYQWKRNRNLTLDGIPNEIYKTEGGEEKIFNYLISRTSLGR